MHNSDSFSCNLVQLDRGGQSLESKVIRNDEKTVEEIRARNQVISFYHRDRDIQKDAGVCEDVIRSSWRRDSYSGRVPGTPGNL